MLEKRRRSTIPLPEPPLAMTLPLLELLKELQADQKFHKENGYSTATEMQAERDRILLAFPKLAIGLATAVSALEEIASQEVKWPADRANNALSQLSQL